MTVGQLIKEAEDSLAAYIEEPEKQTLELAKVEALIAIAKCLDNFNKNGVMVKRP